MEDLSLILPMEIIHKITIFCSSPIADMFKQSKFHGKPFPFLHTANSTREKCMERVREDYHQIHRDILKHRKLQPNFKTWRYRMYHVYQPNNVPVYFYGVDKLYFLDMTRFKNEMGMWECRINLFPEFTDPHP